MPTLKSRGPPERIKTPIEYRNRMRTPINDPVAVRVPVKQFKEPEHINMPRDLSNREIKRHIKR